MKISQEEFEEIEDNFNTYKGEYFQIEKIKNCKIFLN
jgi:hypothetical protein